MAKLIILGILFGGVTFYAIFTVVVCRYYEYHNKKFAKNHPDYIELQNRVIEMGNANWEWRNLIDQKKKAIDEALDLLKYATAEQREKIEKQLETWRHELAEIQDEARPHFQEHIILRDRLNALHDEYVKNGELKEL